MDRTLLDIICCPVTRLPLEQLESERLAQLNTAISAGAVSDQTEAPLADPLEEALVTRDGRRVYPVKDGIPILLEEACIDWSQVAS